MFRGSPITAEGFYLQSFLLKSNLTAIKCLKCVESMNSPVQLNSQSIITVFVF